MSSTTNDSLGHSLLDTKLPSPPHYTEATAPRDEKVFDNSTYSHSPWLLRRTSIHVESTHNEAWQDDSSSHHGTAPSVRSNDEKKALRNLLTKFGNKPAEDQSEDGKSQRDLGQFHDSSDFGTRVFIEAGQPSKVQTRRRHEMKGLEQAASVKRWPGHGKPAEPWGKLAKVNSHSVSLLMMRGAEVLRTLKSGIPLEIRWCTMATSVHKPPFESSHLF